MAHTVGSDKNFMFFRTLRTIVDMFLKEVEVSRYLGHFLALVFVPAPVKVWRILLISNISNSIRRNGKKIFDLTLSSSRN